MMPHFWVDDGWHKHRKRIMTGMDMEGFAARGLWIDAGSWCADELTDGWLPAYIVDYLCPGFGRDLAKRLERARLWEPGIRDGEDGWQYHDWDDFQLLRDEVMAQRQRKADSGALGNHRRWHTRRGKTDPTCKYCKTGQNGNRTSDRSSESGGSTPDVAPDRTPTPTAQPVSHPDRTTDRTTDRTADRTCDQSWDQIGTEVAKVRRTSDRSSDNGAIPPYPVPQPIPKEEQTLFAAADASAGPDAPSTELVAADRSPKVKRGTRLPEGWMPSPDARSWAAAEYPGVDLRTEHMKFTNYWLDKAGRDATKISWDRTWRNWIITAAERIGPRAKQAAVLDDGRAVHHRTVAHLDHLSRYGDDNA